MKAEDITDTIRLEWLIENQVQPYPAGYNGRMVARQEMDFITDLSDLRQAIDAEILKPHKR
jgi:hypothetical protein